MKLTTLIEKKSRSSLDVTFITDETGDYRVDQIKFTKKGAILANIKTGLAAYVDFSKQNEILLKPDTWRNLYISANKGKISFAQSDEKEANKSDIVYDTDMGCFLVIPF